MLASSNPNFWSVNTMSLEDHWNAACAEHVDLMARVRSECAASFMRLAAVCCHSLETGGKLMLFGNGGSAADAQHIATELTIRYLNDRPALAAIALTTDTSALTAAGNDLGFERIFSRQVEALGRPGDVAIGISTSGNSPNVLAALAVARETGMTAAGFAGRDGGKMCLHADPLLIVPSRVTARIQEMHIFVGHLLCEAIEQHFGYMPLTAQKS